MPCIFLNITKDCTKSSVLFKLFLYGPLGRQLKLQIGAHIKTNSWLGDVQIGARVLPLA